MKTLIVGPLLFLLAATGCVVRTNGHPPPPPEVPDPGNVTFTWSFSGVGCAEVPQVDKVYVQIPGETLQNGGVYPCQSNNYPGIVLQQFKGGNYSFTIEALDATDRRLFVGSGTFRIDGDTQVTIDLKPDQGASSYAYLFWRFPGNQSCQQMGVSFVDVYLDDGFVDRHNCIDGQSAQGVTTPYLTAGAHPLTLIAYTQTDYELFRFEGTLTTFSGRPVSADYELPWSVGGAAVGWSLTNGSLSQNCAQAGVTTVYVNFQDAQGAWVYGDNGDPHGCGAAPVLYDYLYPGTYKIFMRGVGPNGVVYASNFNVAPTVTVQAGVFKTSADAIGVQLFRQ